MKDKAFRALEFLRVIDGQHNLSLTNLALIAVLVRIMALPTIDVESLLSFVAVLVGYQVRRVASGLTGTPAEDETAALQEAIKSLQTKITGLELNQQRNRS